MVAWKHLPEYMKHDSVLYYYDLLQKKRIQLFFKRITDILFSVVLIILLFPLMTIVSVAIKCDSKGPVFFRQKRITSFGRDFSIYKFRTMVVNAETIGSSVTVQNDSRITRVGSMLRKLRIDEVPQLFNVLKGEMSFVGTRPEVPHYVEKYSNEMYATLLMRAGITSSASIAFKDEDTILHNAKNVDSVYVQDVLPKKMAYNLAYIEKYSIYMDFLIMIKTVLAVLK